MAAPELIPITKDIWQKVATAVLSGRFKIKSSNPVAYFYTYVDTGTAAPGPAPSPIGNRFFNAVTLEHGSPVDFYIYCSDADGSIEAQL